MNDSTRMMFRTVDDFYNADVNRKYSGEADYGGYWRLDPWHERWRVSYIEKTGEIYAVCSARRGTGPVFVLGYVPPDTVTDERKEIYYRTLDRILEGWPEHCGKPNSLQWLRDKLATANNDLPLNR